MYLDYFGLRENPFNMTSDPDFLYLSNIHKEAIDHLLYGIRERKGFIAVTGEVGSGKTTLCRALMSRVDRDTNTSLIFNSNLPENQLLEAVLMDFGITPSRRSRITFLKELNDFLLTQLREGRNNVLIIDEAQNLRNSALETIRMLSNLETHKEKLLQIILVGQPQLRDKLDSTQLEQLKQRISVRFHLTALDREEIPSYINHRLDVAGNRGNIEFPEDSLNRIYEYTKGIPRKINLVCDKSLLMGFVNETGYISPDTVDNSINEIEGIRKPSLT